MSSADIIVPLVSAGLGFAGVTYATFTSRQSDKRRQQAREEANAQALYSGFTDRLAAQLAAADAENDDLRKRLDACEAKERRRRP